ADRNRSHWSTSKTPSYTKSVSWQHHPLLIHSHINMLGHYTSSLPEDILKGELRSLNFNTNN
ncbi:hypothetical protein, partial [Escherichia coli]|uniref:hypothetical protein n=1 Tax=Escherichia coli TaxID=562 RepID=UPI0019644384